ncbi:MAG TPA: DNA repair protein RecN [Azonexus sp.]|jgi:DNA repair protein RecN (Recombination protein N)|uniref:DNA repair protein RecN n=1 Tax=Candidatus Dechloromonas phosphorivorans TaxID=2899244 RepID=A0A9D7QJ94_9RHOO|nr:DNA repair protein RecN [Candidatus Dechloromonas phosphorivorans]HRH14755.1 DNA repair protein RecN [Azonexus sp.]
MLRHLAIRDFVIVDRLELGFSPGFGALTGETGAGKSILIDALALALGDRADAGVVRAGSDKAEVAATFEIGGLPQVAAWLAANDFDGDDELLLRRVLDAGGRSRGYINGSPATAQQLREVGEFLVDIHGQHAHQSLLRADAQRALLDSHAGLTAGAQQVATSYRLWRDAASALKLAASGTEALEREREQLEWQVRELATLAFAEDEWTGLELEHNRLAHAASLIEGAQFALDVLSDGEATCSSQLDRVATRVAGLASYDPDLQEVSGLLGSAQAELAEAVSTLRRYAGRVDLDPARLAEVERRMEAVLACARKYRAQPAELPGLLAGWQARLETLNESADLDALAARVEGLHAEYLRHARELSAGRQRVAGEMAAAVSALMQKLALASGRFEVGLLALAEGSVYGLEQVEFRVGGLAGLEAKPLAKVASGGELSRISLAIQVLTSRSASVPTLIFDEVDVGIGGGVAEIVGRLLRELGGERQVLCVTHLPQVAARAEWQWQVSKATRDGATLSSIEPLDDEQRVREIARMLGGVEVTDITLEHARELLRSTPENARK